MANNLKEKEEKIQELKVSLIVSANRRIAEKSAEFSNREKNILLNDFEYSTGKISLDSTPEGIGIGAHYHCNAKCVFCLGGKPALFTLKRYKEFFEPRLDSFISRARYVSFCGYGELLLMPGIETFLDYINVKIPNTLKIFTTNGLPLRKDIAGILIKTRSTVEISLHAENNHLHRMLTGMDAFEQIVSQIKELVRLRKSKNSPGISLIFILTTLNIENLPEFVRFAADLGVDEVFCNYMTIFSLAHLKLSCFFKQGITNTSFARAQEIARKRNIILKLPPKFGKNAHNAGQRCSDPWKLFYVENEGSVNPCCHAGTHFGYLDIADSMTMWNGTNYRQLRSALIEGPPHHWCRYCYKYRSENVNDIRSHITFRPGIREKVLRGYRL
ncbi:MAG: SPASM domain-containing protein [Candidatus Omnitrophica bacterium]|nr:SPASM domain-containing protein [Candidatus Omnitrophota bacterium]